MIDRFLKYSLENGRKITAVFLKEGAVYKKNLQVISIDPDGEHFSAVFSGKKKAETLSAGELLTADYARGDHGELE